MNTEQKKAILTIALFAALADGANSNQEREQLRQLAETLGGETGAYELPRIYQLVLLKQVDLKAAAAILVELEHRQLAYEMAACICDTDGPMSALEKRFLAELATVLKLDEAFAGTANRQAEAMAELAGEAAPSVAVDTAVAWGNTPVVAATARISDAELDKSILNYAILNGALELLPQSWASMAIIPLQIKMVYGIGKEHGYELDQGHIRELLSTLGVGLTSQYLEQFGRKLLGGLLGKAMGGLGKQLGKSATSIAFSFATTYALGQVARRYYAGGRQMSSALLQDTFQSLLGPAKEMQSRYLPQIQQKANGLDVNQIMAMVRGA